MPKYEPLIWHALSMQVDCEKCRNKVAFQTLFDHPKCKECGHTGNISWIKIIEEAGLLNMFVEGSRSKTMDGTAQLYIYIEKKDGIHCVHCKSLVTIKEDEKFEEVHCDSCKHQLLFDLVPELGNLLFYNSHIQHSQVAEQKTSIISFNCNNCGGPLKADSKRNSIFCEFCGTQNEIKRGSKIPVSQMLVARRTEIYPRGMAFTQNGWRSTQALKEHGRNSFTDEDLNKILITNKNELSVFYTIKSVFNYIPSSLILEELFTTSTNREIIIQSAGLLKKSDKEIEKRLSPTKKK